MTKRRLVRECRTAALWWSLLCCAGGSIGALLAILQREHDDA